MQPPQPFNNPLHPLNVQRPHQRRNLLLHLSIALQKPLDQLPIHEPERLIGLADHAAEAAEFVEGEVAEGVDVGG